MGGVFCLHGIVDTAADLEECPGVVGLDGTSPDGIVAYRGIGCVVGAHPGTELRSLPRETLIRYLFRHQQVVERVMQRHTVLPVKFGSTVDSREDARALLVQAHRDLTEALALMRDKVEVEVVATWDVERTLEEVGREEGVIQAREAIVAGGNSTLEDKVRLGQVVKERLDRRRNAHRERMLDVLQPLAVGAAPNALIAEDMVVNVAFLVERARVSQFDDGVRELDSLFGNRITFRVIGPLPPYSFSTVEITQLTPEQVEQARQELGLPGAHGETEVRKAYRRLAAEVQRKEPSGTKTPADRLARLRWASEVLQASSRRQASRGGRSDVSGGSAADRLFVVSLRGTGYQEVEAARFAGAIRV
ncbi:MAG: GvpL/GvpF family gas vesicle protein [Deltaproteobacteria bacterium]|nr:GvpL/GvpF family gas vesicle protein [Deltaproteobacteria bacterium]